MGSGTTPARVHRLRLAAQGLVGPRATSGAEVVRRLGCVQAQEHAQALWSLGLRSTGLDPRRLADELDAGTVLRTHVLRPTWHLVAAEDLRWVLATTAPRVHQVNGTMYRRCGLDEATLRAGGRVLLGALERACTHLTRAELAQALAGAGLPSAGLPLVLLLMHAELEALVCSGRARGSTQTYAAVAERVPADAPRAPDLPGLALRYLTGHGPAGVGDLARWASLTVTSARAAVAALGGRLTADEVAGVALWAGPENPLPAGPDPPLLLPQFDELLAHRDVALPVAPGHPDPPGADLRRGSVVVDGQNVGAWRRVLRGADVEVSLALADPAVPGREAAAGRAAADLAAFLRRGLEVRLDGA